MTTSSHRISSSLRSIMLSVIIMCLAMTSQICQADYYQLQVSHTVTKYSPSSGTAYQSTSYYKDDMNEVFALMTTGESVRILRGSHNIERPLVIPVNDITVRGWTRDPKDTILGFKSSDWLDIRVAKVAFADLTITNIRQVADLSSKNVTFTNCKFITEATTQVFRFDDNNDDASPSATLKVIDSSFENKDQRLQWSTPFFTYQDKESHTRQGGFLHLNLRTSHAVITSSTFKSGRAYEGGCIWFFTSGQQEASSVQISDTTFSDCVSESDGGAVYTEIRNTHASSSVSFTSSSFTNNKALGDGGAIFVKNIPAVDDVTNPSVDYRTQSLQLADLTFNNNMAYYGGAIFLSSFSVVHVRTGPSKFMKFISNDAVTSGGAIYMYNGQHLDCDLTFEGNTAGQLSTRHTLNPYSQRGSLMEGHRTDSWGQEREYGGSVYIEKSASPHTKTTIIFKENPTSPNLKRNVAKSGGAIGSRSPISLSNVFSQDNYAQNYGGGLWLHHSSEIHSSKFVSDRTLYVNGGCIFMNGGSSTDSTFTGTDILLRSCKCGQRGAGLYVGGRVSSVALSNVKFIGGYNVLGGTAVYFTPNVQSALTIGGESLVWGNQSWQTFAAVVVVASKSVTVDSNDVEYRHNRDGHLTFEGPSSVVYTSTNDYFDESSIVDSNPSIRMNTSVQKTFTNTFFRGMCGEHAKTKALSTIYEKCSSDAAPLTYPGGLWGSSSQCSLSGAGCQAPSTPSSANCEETRLCYLDIGGTARNPRMYDSYLVNLIPELTTTPSPPTTTTTTTTTTPPPPTTTTTTTTTTPPPPTTSPPPVVTKDNACELSNKHNVWARFGSRRYETQEGCERKGFCYIAPGVKDEWWHCWAPESTGQLVRTPGTTCDVEPRLRVAPGTSAWMLLGGPMSHKCQNIGACWVPPLEGEHGPSCFWGDKRNLDDSTTTSPPQ